MGEKRQELSARCIPGGTLPGRTREGLIAVQGESLNACK